MESIDYKEAAPALAGVDEETANKTGAPAENPQMGGSNAKPDIRASADAQGNVANIRRARTAREQADQQQQAPPPEQRRSIFDRFFHPNRQPAAPPPQQQPPRQRPRSLF